MHGSVGFVPDLHETVYPLVTEMLYAVALEFRGPVACRGIQWVLGLVFAANVTALARPSLGRRAWWAGAIALLGAGRVQRHVGPAQRRRPGRLRHGGHLRLGSASRTARAISAAIAGGLLAGLAIGVKYPALVLCGLLAPAIALRVLDRRPSPAARRATCAGSPWRLVYLATAVAVGRLVVPAGLCAHGQSGVSLFPRRLRRSRAGRGARPDQAAAAGHARSTCSFALVPLSLQPDRFDSFSHQFGPVFLLFLPAIFLERRSAAGAGAGRAGVCVPHPLHDPAPEHAVSSDRARTDVDRRGLPGERLVQAADASPHGCSSGSCSQCMGFEAGLAVARSRHVLAVLLGRESAAEFLARREPTFTVGQWAAQQPARGGPADRSGPPRILHPARLHDGAGPSPADGPGPPR